MLATCLAYQHDFTLCYFARIGAAQGFSLMMHGEHDAGGLCFRFMEIFTQNINHEVHGCKIIVEQQHLIHRGPLQPGLICHGERMFFEDSDAHACNIAHSGCKSQSGV